MALKPSVRRRIAHTPSTFCRKPLSLSTFTIDEYEHALYHNNPLQPCTLIQEIHQSLLSVIRTDALTNQDLVLPLKAAVPPDGDGSGGGETSDESDDEDEDKQEKIKLATNQAGILAANFAAQDASGGKVSKRDWEGMLAGCLWQVSDERGHQTCPSRF